MNKQYPKQFNVWKILEEYLDSQKMNKDDRDKLIKEIVEYFTYPKTSDLKTSLSNNKQFDSEKWETQGIYRDFRTFMRMLYLGFNIPFKGYLTHEDIFTERSPNLGHLQKFEHLDTPSDPSDERIEKFVDQYDKALKSYICSASKRIWVYEILSKGRKSQPGEGIRHYSEAHEKIFARIEDQIRKHEKFDYVRLLVLPHEYNDDSISNEDKIIAAITECSLAVFKHICRCIKDYPKQANFHAVWRTSYMHHFGILDDHYIVSEYYRYNADGDFVPDLLFVESVFNNEAKEMKKLLNIYEIEIRKRFRDRSSRKITFDLLKTFLQLAIKKVSNEIIELDHRKDKTPEMEKWLDKLNDKAVSLEKKNIYFLKCFPNAVGIEFPSKGEEA